MRFVNLFKRFNQVGLSVSIFTIASVGRVIYSADRLPPDPGYGFFEESHNSNLWVIFRTEGGYLDVPRRLLSEVVVLFPIRYSAFIGTGLWVLLCSLSALAVMFMILRAGFSFLVALISGLLVVLPPSASESQVGNQSVVKWFLLLLLIFALSLPPEKQIKMSVLVSLIVIAGISNPVTFLVFGAFVTLTLTRREKLLMPRNRIIILAFSLGFAIEFVAWKSTGVGVHKYDDSVYQLWSGAGAFWYYNFLTPLLTLLVALLLKIRRFRFPEPSVLIVNLACYGLIVWLGTYYLGGIADRYLVVPQVLGFVVFLLYLAENFRAAKRSQILLFTVYACVAIISLVYWYQASWFLSSGPRWSEEIDRRVIECKNSPIESVTVEQFMGNFEITCRDLLSRT
jgi:hypothetical protein